MPVNPTLSSNIVYGARVADDSSLPLFSEQFPGLIDPSLIRYVDRFARAVPINGTQTEVGTPPLTWTAASFVSGNVSPSYARVTGVTQSAGNGAWVQSGANGEVMALVEIGDNAGAVGVVFRCTATSGDHWRAAVHVGLNQAILQCRGATTRNFAVALPQTPAIGDRYLVRVAFDGPHVSANVAGVPFEVADATQYQSTSGSGIYFLNSSAVSAHKVLACYIA